MSPATLTEPAMTIPEHMLNSPHLSAAQKKVFGKAKRAATKKRTAKKSARKSTTATKSSTRKRAAKKSSATAAETPVTETK